MKQRFEQLLNFTHQDIQSSLFKSLFDLTDIGQLLKQEKNDHFLFYFMKCYTNSPRIIKFMLKEFIPEGLGEIAFKQLRIITACLHEENLFNLENFDLMLSCAYPEQMMSQYHAINLLNIFGILDADNRNFLKFKPNPEEHAQILIELHQHELLTNEIKNILKNHASPRQLSQNLIILQQAGLNTPQNRQLILNHPHQQTIKNAFLALQNAHILDQNHLNGLFNPEHYLLLTHPASEIIWGRIPEQHLSRHWNLILHQARQALIFNRTHHLDLAFIGHLQQFIENLLMGHNEPQPQVQNMNPAQSTHTASVHQSVSQSAIKLYQRYQHLIQQQSQLEQYICSIQEFIMQLPNHSIENRAAKNCINRITNNQYVFVDSISQVSTRQLLALSYIAILDDKLRQASWENANQQFISALHEIQRGYNEHDGELDQPICAAGTFNKLIEKLQTVHPDCEIRFITKQLAALKLPKVVLNNFTTYLKTHPLSAEDLEHLRLNGIEVIWNELESGVCDCMFNEFGSLYPSQQHDDFKSLIANGIYVDISEVLPPTNSQLASLNIFSNSGNQEPKSCDHHYSNCP